MRTPLFSVSALALFFFVVALGFWSAPNDARAQAGCHPVTVVSVRPARVELYDLQGHFQSTVPKAQLGAITQATECGQEAQFLAIQTPDGLRLVRRIALELPATAELPPCPCGTFAQNNAHDASSSGLGISCRPQPRC